jgi:hypothetical protein
MGEIEIINQSLVMLCGAAWLSLGASIIPCFIVALPVGALIVDAKQYKLFN